MSEWKPVENLRKHVAQIYLLLLSLHRNSTDNIKAVRCHESARIFYEVLKDLGYRVEVVNGGYSLSKKNRMQHSWVESVIDVYGTRLLIETAPHLFFPKLSFEELVGKMMIPPDDERRQKYFPVEDYLFLQVLKKRGVKDVDVDLVKSDSTLILKALNERKTKKFANG
jgi:hypothetical protein